MPPRFTPAGPLQFVVNGKAGSADADATRESIETGLRESGRTGTVHFAGPGDLVRVAHEGAASALAHGSAVIAVGGDGTINTVAQAAYAAGCAMGVLPGGTFNYVAREHGVPTDTDEALRFLFDARPHPVQVPALNGQLFLVNASLGLYPDLLQDRERWQARFGRSRLVAFGAGMATLLGARNRLRLTIEWDGGRREVRTLTLFVGNNQLQLEQLGLVDASAKGGTARSDGGITAIILRPIGVPAMLSLMLRGALGQLGDARGIEHLWCHRLTVSPGRAWGRRGVKVAYDGEVTWMRAPLEIRILPTPLWMLKAPV